MTKKASQAVVSIPVDQIRVVNRRMRGKGKFQQIVKNISNAGLKRPITVTSNPSEDDKTQYDLVCGQGRLEALQALGETHIPAIIIDVDRKTLLLMSLIENLARPRHNPVDLAQQIEMMRKRGIKDAEIARITGMSVSYIYDICRLLRNGERRLLQAVEWGHFPISVAVTIASADNVAIQRLLTEAYENNKLQGRELMRVRKLIESKQRELLSKNGNGHAKLNGKGKQAELVTLRQAYHDETTRQKALIARARRCESLLLYVTAAFRDMLKDDGFVNLLRAESLDTIPQPLADRLREEET
ncbi:MAG: ParB/RepB/Spo0J family partition protein [Planctomycetota bacterium]